MPRVLQTRRAVFMIALGLCLLCGRTAHGQGFDDKLHRKTKITLHRKLPPVVHFSGTKIDTKVMARDPKYDDVKGSLNDQLLTDLLKYNPRFQADSKSPELIVICTVESFEVPKTIPPPLTEFYTRTRMVWQKGKQIPVTISYYRVNGQLELSYHAQDPSGHTLDAENVSEKYSEEFQAGTNENTGESLQHKLATPIRKMQGKKDDEPNGPPTVSDLRLKLIHDALHEIVPRITTTDEPVEVLLGRGKLDDANKSAQAGLWTRYLEQLEQMPPLPKIQDDSYRLFNIGVAYEAQAYQAEDREAAKTALQQAMVFYGKAIDAKPDEKYYLGPQKRIETAMLYFRKIETQKKEEQEVKKTEPSPGPGSPTQPGDSTANTTNSPGSTKPKPSNKSLNSNSGKSPTDTATTQKPSDNGASKPAASTVKTASKPKEPPLDNQQIIDMVKAGVPEAAILRSIRNAAAVDFDLSSPGLVKLATAGVKSDNIIGAMQARANHRATAGSS
jgi:hypothetical protein